MLQYFLGYHGFGQFDLFIGIKHTYNSNVQVRCLQQIKISFVKQGKRLVCRFYIASNLWKVSVANGYNAINGIFQLFNGLLNPIPYFAEFKFVCFKDATKGVDRFIAFQVFVNPCWAFLRESPYC